MRAGCFRRRLGTGCPKIIWFTFCCLVSFLLLEVTAQIDISPIVEDYGGDNGGQPPFHPRMMLVLLLYAYSVGVFSSRKIMQRCATDAAFRVWSSPRKVGAEKVW